MNSVGLVKFSIIVTTYNWPDALRSVLTALIHQKTSHLFEIIVADDGSTPETAELIREFQACAPCPLSHIWQMDEGFRVATIRNKAISAARGSYIIFLDGDCIPRENFIERHAILAEANTFVSGNRVLLSQAFTLKTLSKRLPLHQWGLLRWVLAWTCGRCNRWIPFLSLPLSRLWGLRSAHRWQGIKGCNLAVWKTDLQRVNGWEEAFIGWGYEDSDLAIRLLRAGIQRKEGRFQIPVMHLWHPENDRSRIHENWVLFKTRDSSDELRAKIGLNQYDT